MNPAFKPMLATQVDNLQDIKYPVYASTKLDGIRCTIFNGVALSRSLKPIRNKQIQQWASDNANMLEGVDGEFIVGSPTDSQVFLNTTSFVMSFDKQEDFSFYAFDLVQDTPAEYRQKALEQRNMPSNVKVVAQVLIKDSTQLEAFRTAVVEQGYEGVMVKAINGKYKYGRSSIKEGLLLKLKLFKDDEFEIVGYDCKYHNSNEAITNELGRTARSSAKEGLIPLDTLGVLYLQTKQGKIFGCGSGFDDKHRNELWLIRDSLKGQLATVKYFDLGGYETPRFPIFKSIRFTDDL